MVKIGGSLESFQELPKLLQFLADKGKGRVVIVPGGGSFAEAVRRNQQRLGYSDTVAHSMAVLAMEQYACFLMSLQPGLQVAADLASIKLCLEENASPVWFPGKLLEAEKNLPRNWKVTSDSLSVWLAIKLKAESLVLIKSGQVPDINSSADELAGLGLIDGFFGKLLEDSTIRAFCLHRDKYARALDIKPGIQIS